MAANLVPVAALWVCLTPVAADQSFLPSLANTQFEQRQAKVLHDAVVEGLLNCVIRGDMEPKCLRGRHAEGEQGGERQEDRD